MLGKTTYNNRLNSANCHCTKNKVSIKYFLTKCDQICKKLRIWLHLLKKPLMEYFIFCAVLSITEDHNIFDKPVESDSVYSDYVKYI